MSDSEESQMATAQPADEALTFGEAMSELERILRRIESEEVDIDQLAEELRRASQLVGLCRGKIRKAEMEIDQVVDGLESSE